MTHRDADTDRQTVENQQLRAQLAAKDRQIKELHRQIEALIAGMARLREQVQELSDAIRDLKNLPKRPNIKPSGIQEQTKTGTAKKRRRGQRKPQQYSDKAHTKDVTVELAKVPQGSQFKGYKTYTIQDFVLLPLVIKYKREIWLTPDGKHLTAPVPEHVRGHYGGNVQRLVVALYTGAQSTVPRITELLNDWGVSISKRTVQRMLNGDVSDLVTESEQVLAAGMAGADWLHVDDTGARHQHQNGYCTVIGNDRFTHFITGASKSRLNFLKCLHASVPGGGYVLNEQAFEYLRRRKLPIKTIALLENAPHRRFDSAAAFEAHLAKLGIHRKVYLDPVTIATEGALWGALDESGILDETVILSDDAGQFNVGQHQLCWVHAERGLLKLSGLSEAHREAIEAKRNDIWNYYRELQQYCQQPDATLREALRQRFDEIFTTPTCYHPLNQQLKRLYDNKSELLKVLDYPLTPLHNNLAENDIRAQVTRRKISAGTKSDSGRQARDACLGLLKTCRKQQQSFWDYLGHRLKVPDAPYVPNLATLVSQRE